MSVYEFMVEGCPISQPRQRHRIIKTGAGKIFSANYTPAKDPVNSWKSFVRDAARKAGVQVITGPVVFEGHFFLPRPVSLSRKKDPDGPIPHAGAKDLDNLYKAVTDALIGIAYKDDRQIFLTRVAKYYHEKNGAPRAMFTITKWEEQSDVETAGT